MDQKPFKINAIVELFGHTRLAGVVSEAKFPAGFVRIDVPETKEHTAWTKIVNPQSIYSLNPVTEEVMKHMTEVIHEQSIEAWDISKIQKNLLAAKAPELDFEED